MSGQFSLCVKKEKMYGILESLMDNSKKPECGDVKIQITFETISNENDSESARSHQAPDNGANDGGNHLARSQSADARGTHLYRDQRASSHQRPDLIALHNHGTKGPNVELGDCDEFPKGLYFFKKRDEHFRIFYNRGQQSTSDNVQPPFGQNLENAPPFPVGHASPTLGLAPPYQRQIPPLMPPPYLPQHMRNNPHHVQHHLNNMLHQNHIHNANFSRSRGRQNQNQSRSYGNNGNARNGRNVTQESTAGQSSTSARLQNSHKKSAIVATNEQSSSSPAINAAEQSSDGNSNNSSSTLPDGQSSSIMEQPNTQEEHVEKSDIQEKCPEPKEVEAAKCDVKDETSSLKIPEQNETSLVGLSSDLETSDFPHNCLEMKQAGEVENAAESYAVSDGGKADVAEPVVVECCEANHAEKVVCTTDENAEVKTKDSDEERKNEEVASAVKFSSISENEEIVKKKNAEDVEMTTNSCSILEKEEVRAENFDVKSEGSDEQKMQDVKCSPNTQNVVTSTNTLTIPSSILEQEEAVRVQNPISNTEENAKKSEVVQQVSKENKKDLVKSVDHATNNPAPTKTSDCSPSLPLTTGTRNSSGSSLLTASSETSNSESRTWTKWKVDTDSTNKLTASNDGNQYVTDFPALPMPAPEKPKPILQKPTFATPVQITDMIAKNKLKLSQAGSASETGKQQKKGSNEKNASRKGQGKGNPVTKSQMAQKDGTPNHKVEAKKANKNVNQSRRNFNARKKRCTKPLQFADFLEGSELEPPKESIPTTSLRGDSNQVRRGNKGPNKGPTRNK